MRNRLVFRSLSTVATTSCMLFLLLAGVARADAVLLEFTSDACPPCRAMQPVVSELIARGVPVRQVDVQQEPQITRRYQIRSTPTYIVLRDGREVKRMQGVQSIETLREALQTTGAGPILPTGSQINQPQTRLAPMASNSNNFAASPDRSIRRDNSGVDAANAWQSLTSRSAEQAGQSKIEAMPSPTLAQAVELAQAATVRLRVYDGNGYGAGTGTIIDTHGNEALVLTCGHLFRESESNDKIEVDLFVGGQPKTVMGQLIDFDAGDRDIGLVAIQPGMDVKPVRVIQEGDVVRTGQVAFSFGCDRGDPPSRRDTRITGVDKYNQSSGASNLEIAGAPIDGRSGGGLFDESGRLIGVCNAADYQSDIGIYTGPRSIQWQLDRVRLSRLYQNGGDVPAASLANGPATTTPASIPAPADFSQADSTFGNPPTPIGSVTGTNRDAPAGGDLEMIVIVRDPSGAAAEQVFTLRQPDATLVQQIRQAARR